MQNLLRNRIGWTLLAVGLVVLCSGCGSKQLQPINGSLQQYAVASEPVKRLHYFQGQILTAQDFQDEQTYDNSKRRLHNQCLHGWGVVCGLWVQANLDHPTRVSVSPGLALDAQGREVLVSQPVSLSLAEYQGDVYLALAYHEELVDVVPSIAQPASAEQDASQATRIQEGFVLSVLDELPADYVPTYRALEAESDGKLLERILQQHLVCCDGGSDQPLVLAKVNVKHGKHIKTDGIDNVRYRRVVLNNQDMSLLFRQLERD